MSDRVNVLCFKWGRRYPALFVNRLYLGVKANLKRPFRFVCVTDEAEGLMPGVEAVPFPEAPEGWTRKWPSIFVKLMVFKDGFADLRGPTLFLDIDQIILGELDAFFDYEPGRFCIIRNWIERRKQIFRKIPPVGNSSCFRFEAGSSGAVYEKFLEEMDTVFDQRLYRTEQAYMTHAVGLENISWWPDDYVRSFKRSCARIFPLNLFLAPKRAEGVRILCFHGHPDPDQAITGFKGRHLNTWTRPAPWLKELWELDNQSISDR